MVTPEFQPFFTASVAASSALIGLLFVSVSIAPERVFGDQAEAERQGQALSAFTALANVFFISLISLVPNVIFGLVVSIISLPAIMQTLALLGLVRQWHRAGIVVRGLFLFLASATVYGYELALGIQLWRQPTFKAALVSLLFVLMGAYAIGLGRAWELLGAPRIGLFSYLLSRLGARSKRAPGDATKPKS